MPVGKLTFSAHENHYSNHAKQHVPSNKIVLQRCTDQELLHLYRLLHQLGISANLDVQIPRHCLDIFCQLGHSQRLLSRRTLPIPPEGRGEILLAFPHG